MAALSVHSSTAGTQTGTPSSATAVRSSEFAATPPPMASRSSPSLSSASRVRLTSASTMARW